MSDQILRPREHWLRLAIMLLLLAGFGGLLVLRHIERRLMRLAQSAYDAQQFDAAAHFLRAYLMQRPGDHDAQLLAARIADRRGAYVEVDYFLSGIKGLLPEDLHLHARALLKLKAWSRARAIFEFLVEQRPNDIEALVQLATIEGLYGEYQKAIGHAERAAESAAGTDQAPRCHYLLGTVHLAMGNFKRTADQFLIALQTAGATNGRLPLPAEEIRLAVVEYLLTLGHIQEARDQLEQIPRGEPDDIRRLYAQGRLDRAAGNTKSAESNLRLVLALDSDHVGALVELGQLYLATDRPQAAAQMLARAAPLAEKSAQVHYLLAQVYRKLGESNKAEEASRTHQRLRALAEEESNDRHFVQNWPDHPKTKWLLARRAHASGDMSLATALLKDALKRDANFEPAKKMLRELESVGP